MGVTLILGIMNPTILLHLGLLSSLSLSMAEISCYICTPSIQDPMKCRKPEYLGTYKKCPPESLTCYKSVDPNTGEVRKGCGGMDSSKTMQPGVYNCDTELCNNAGDIQIHSMVMLGVVYIL